MIVGKPVTVATSYQGHLPISDVVIPGRLSVYVFMYVLLLVSIPSSIAKLINVLKVFFLGSVSGPHILPTTLLFKCQSIFFFFCQRENMVYDISINVCCMMYKKGPCFLVATSSLFVIGRVECKLFLWCSRNISFHLLIFVVVGHRNIWISDSSKYFELHSY